MKRADDSIYFYSISDEYGAFSNFATYPMNLGC